MSSTEQWPDQPKWSMYAALHNDVSRHLRNANLHFNFHQADNSQNCIREHDTNIMGKFTCQNPSCHSRTWSSQKIAITIRMYPRRRYNARVYHQACSTCERPCKPDLDDVSYVERVVYRLKKWSGIQMERPPYSGQSKGPPHRSHLCEGCKAGHCGQLRNKRF